MNIPNFEEIPLVRTSTRTDFARCLFQWDLKWNNNFIPLEDRAPLVFGTNVHKCFEHWYKPGIKRGVHPAITWEALWEEQEAGWNIMADDNWADARELGKHLMEDYVKFYGKEPHYESIWAEQPFEILLLRDGEPICIYCGTFDGIGYDHDENHYIIQEHKTAAAINTNHLVLDEQANSYWALSEPWLNQMYDEEAELSHILYNYVRKGKRDDRPTDKQGRSLNKDGSVSKKQPVPRFYRERIFRGPWERAKVLHRIESQVLAMHAFADGDLPLYKAPADYCSWCDFNQVCEVEESDGDWEEMLEMAFSQETDMFVHHRDSLEQIDDLDDLVQIEISEYE